MNDDHDFQFSGVPKEDLLHDVSRQPRIEDWDEYFLAIAFLVARKSKDPSTKTGCVVQRERRILATGYNGFPRGCPDDCALYADRKYKYKNIAHCEANAVFAAAFQGVALFGATMYSTSPPCTECSQAIINAGIIRSVWPAANKFECDAETGKRWDGDATGDAQALVNLKNAGVLYERFPRD
jgi:dCMP deaminase